MSDQIREQVSAFLDGELPSPETELLLKRLMRDAELRGGFGRYSLIGEAMRATKGDAVTQGFAGRVNRLIDGEPVIAVSGGPVRPRSRGWWRPLAGAAVAAGVAAVAVVALERRADVPTAAVSNLVAVSLPATGALRVPRSSREAVSYTVPAVETESAGALPAARLTNYVFAHSRYSSGLGQRNVLSELIAEQPADRPPPNDPLQKSVPLAASP